MIVMHVDFDYFYAQCEEVRNPLIRGRPVVVCVYSDRGGDSGAVATANYEARRYKVKSGISITLAKKRLDGAGAVFLPVDFGHYSDVSGQAMNIMRGRSDVFEYVGRDEAYLDVSERTEGDMGSALHLAQDLKNRIRQKLKLTCSVGVAPNKLLAKIASNFKKPDGLTAIRQEEAEAFVEGLNVRDIPGIGKKTEQILSRSGAKSVPDLKRMDVFDLSRMFGKKTGAYIYNSARGISEEQVRPKESNVQYGKLVTLSRDSDDAEFLRAELNRICDVLLGTVWDKGLEFRVVGIEAILADMTHHTKSRMLKSHTDSGQELKRVAAQLLSDWLASNRGGAVRRLGVKVSELSELSGQASIESYF